jgi:hypothetical protein
MRWRMPSAVREPDLVEHAAHVCVRRREPVRAHADLQVLQRARALVQRWRLDDRPDLADGLAEARLPRLVAEDACVALRRPLEAEQHAHRGRLAGAVGPEQPDDRAFGHGERQPVDHRAAAEALDQPVELEGVRLAGRHVDDKPTHLRARLRATCEVRGR